MQESRLFILLIAYLDLSIHAFCGAVVNDKMFKNYRTMNIEIEHFYCTNQILHVISQLWKLNIGYDILQWGTQLLAIRI